MAIQTVGNQDLVNMQANLNERTGATITKMNNLAQTAQNKSGEELQKIQIELAALQRDLDILKQMEEKLAKAMEALSKFIQPQ